MYAVSTFLIYWSVLRYFVIYFYLLFIFTVMNSQYCSYRADFEGFSPHSGNWYEQHMTGGVLIINFLSTWHILRNIGLYIRI